MPTNEWHFFQYYGDNDFNYKLIIQTFDFIAYPDGTQVTCTWYKFLRDL